MESLGKAVCDGKVEGKVPEEVKAEELADDAGSGSHGGRDWGSPECCARPGRAQVAQSFPRAPPRPLIPCSSAARLSRRCAFVLLQGISECVLLS